MFIIITGEFRCFWNDALPIFWAEYFDCGEISKSIIQLAFWIPDHPNLLEGILQSLNSKKWSSDLLWWYSWLYHWEHSDFLSNPPDLLSGSHIFQEASSTLGRWAFPGASPGEVDKGRCSPNCLSKCSKNDQTSLGYLDIWGILPYSLSEYSTVWNTRSPPDYHLFGNYSLSDTGYCQVSTFMKVIQRKWLLSSQPVGPEKVVLHFTAW